MRPSVFRALLCSAMLVSGAAQADEAAPAMDWPLYGLDYTNQRYSPLA